MAQLLSKNELKIGEEFVHESYIGSKFNCRVKKTTTIKEYDGITPVIRGWAKIYGYNKIIVDDDDDPFCSGFQVI